MNDVNLTYTFSTPPELVFDAWTKVDLIRKWLFAGPTSEIVNVSVNLKVNGKFSILELDERNNAYIDHFGKYLEISFPKKPVFTLFVPEHFPGETKISIEIQPKDEGCELNLTQSGVSRDVVEESWKKMLEQLRLVLENQ